MSILVAYFSASAGKVTEKMAEKLAKAVDGDLFEIKPEPTYTEADLDWTNPESRSSKEMKDNPSFRPPIAEKVDNMDDYDTIFVGFPIWWYIAPTIINTFLESYDLSGKTIIPFASSGSSGILEVHTYSHSAKSSGATSHAPSCSILSRFQINRRKKIPS